MTDPDVRRQAVATIATCPASATMPAAAISREAYGRCAALPSSESYASVMSSYKLLWRDLGLRPFKVRSIIASALLGSEDGCLPSRVIVQFATLFGVPEGTVRITLSRLVAHGDLEIRGGQHHLSGRLAERRRRQNLGREAGRRPWDGAFVIETVRADRREAVERLALRSAMKNLRLAPYRQTLYMRPNNLDMLQLPEDWALVRTQCDRFICRLDSDEREFVGRLWDLTTWHTQADTLRRLMAEVVVDLERALEMAIAPGFMLAAAVTHHLMADPLLPDELLPGDWPGQQLRSEWENFDAIWQAQSHAWLSGGAPSNS